MAKQPDTPDASGTIHGVDMRWSGSEYSHVVQLLQRSHLRITPQRILVLAALLNHPGHASADDILRAPGKQYPTLNRATVYQTLDLFVMKGLVARPDLGGHQAQYEFLGPEPDDLHHHLICQQCGGVMIIDDTAFQTLRRTLDDATGFMLALRPLVLVGYCRECQLTPAEPPAAAGVVALDE